MAAAVNMDVTENDLRAFDTSVMIDNSMTLEMSPQEEHQSTKAKKKLKKRERSTKKAEVQVNEDSEELVPGKKPHKKRASNSEPVYVIPDVERKETTFKGRLGV
jgi:UV DNA damage endonuclease